MMNAAVNLLGAMASDQWRVSLYQNVESVLRTLLVLSDGGEHGQNQAGEDQQEPEHRIDLSVTASAMDVPRAGRCLHIGVVDEGPSSGSLQNVVEEVLQPPVESVSFGGLLASGDAAALPSGTLLPSWTHENVGTSDSSSLQIN